MPVPIVHPPIRRKPFLAQTCADGEFNRRSAAGVKYVRGKHGGFDFQDRSRAPLFAVCGGIVKHVDFGGALGEHQFVIRRADGSGAFYAHTFTRPPAGARVKPGDVVAEMGNSSSFSLGVHLHFETLDTWNDWHSTYNCGKDLRSLQEVLTMFTTDEVKFLKDLIKVAKKGEVDAAAVARAAKRLDKHLTTHPSGSGTGAATHSHTAKVTLT